MGYSKEELNWVKRSQSSVDLWLRVQTSDMNLTIYKVGPEIKLPCTVRFRFWHASFLAPPILAAKRIHFWQYSRIQLKSVFDCKYQRVFALNSSTASLQITNIYARKKKTSENLCKYSNWNQYPKIFHIHHWHRYGNLVITAPPRCCYSYCHLKLPWIALHSFTIEFKRLLPVASRLLYPGVPSSSIFCQILHSSRVLNSFTESAISTGFSTSLLIHSHLVNSLLKSAGFN